MPLRSITVYCGANFGNRPEYTASAEALGRLLAKQQIELVYGGGNVGLMGALAQAALAERAAVVGVIPTFMLELELCLQGLTETHEVTTMRERKAIMLERGEAFIALPGGVGTLEELLEVLEWTAAGRHRKPVGVLNTDGIYTPLLALMRRAVEVGFMDEVCLSSFVVADTPEELLAGLQAVAREATWPTPRGAEALPPTRTGELATESPYSVCGVVLESGNGGLPEHLEAAAQLGTRLAMEGSRVLHTGGSEGLAGALHRAASEHGGRPIGLSVSSSSKFARHDRKQRLFEAAGRYIAMPGGVAVWEELLELLSSMQLGGHQRPMGMLSTGGYYEPLKELLQNTISAGFTKPEVMTYVVDAEDPVVLLEKLRNYKPNYVPKRTSNGEQVQSKL